MRAGKAEWVGGESEGECFRLFLGGLPRREEGEERRADLILYESKIE